MSGRRPTSRRGPKQTSREDDGSADRNAAIFTYTLAGNWTVLAGRSEIDNDELSIRIARPGDWWFHVRGMPGSHVLLRERPGYEPDRDTLKRAAAVAAYHSKARGGGVTAVSCTRARFVTKPRGAKAGTVAIRKETVIKVRPALPEAQAEGIDDGATEIAEASPRRPLPEPPTKDGGDGGQRGAKGE